MPTDDSLRLRNLQRIEDTWHQQGQVSAVEMLIFLAMQAEPSAGRDEDVAVMEWIGQFGQAVMVAP